MNEEAKNSSWKMYLGKLHAYLGQENYIDVTLKSPRVELDVREDLFYIEHSRNDF